MYLNNAMSAVVELLKTKIIAAAKDMVGVWFYGTVRQGPKCQRSAACVACVCASLPPCAVVCVPHQRERKNNNSFDNVYEFIELGPPSATGVKRAESVLAGTFDFDGEIGSVEDGGASPLHHAPESR